MAGAITPKVNAYIDFQKLASLVHLLDVLTLYKEFPVFCGD